MELHSSAGHGNVEVHGRNGQRVQPVGRQQFRVRGRQGGTAHPDGKPDADSADGKPDAHSDYDGKPDADSHYDGHSGAKRPCSCSNQPRLNHPWPDDACPRRPVACPTD